MAKSGQRRGPSLDRFIGQRHRARRPSCQFKGEDSALAFVTHGFGSGYAIGRRPGGKGMMVDQDQSIDRLARERDQLLARGRPGHDFDLRGPVRGLRLQPRPQPIKSRAGAQEQDRHAE